jgi:hypothetical protein
MYWFAPLQGDRGYRALAGILCSYVGDEGQVMIGSELGDGGDRTDSLPSRSPGQPRSIGVPGGHGASLAYVHLRIDL